MVLTPLQRPENEVHLWLAFPDEIRDPGLLTRYHAMLNPEEAAKQKRYHFEKHRHQYLVTRAVIRTQLSRYANVAPEDWVFEANEYGRPHLAPIHPGPHPRFNLSHTDGLIVCAVVFGRELGVDVENVQRGGDLINVADRFFSPTEVEDLHKLPESQHIDRFFDYWTLKESYIKARGMGLSIPLEQFSFHLDQTPAIKITIDPRQNDRNERWQFRQWRIGENYKIALALEREPGRAFKVRMRKLTPLVSETPFSCEEIRNGFD